MISPNAVADDVIYTHQDDYADNYDDVITMEEEREYPLPEYPDTPSLPYRGNLKLDGELATYTIDQDGQYGKIEVGGSKTLNIDVGDGVRKLVVDDFNAGGGGEIKVTGSGKLFLYINNSFYLNINFNKNGDDKKVMLYYGGSSTFGTQGSSALHACVYVKNADVHLGSGVKVAGHIISGGDNVIIDGGMEGYVRVVYAPNAFVNIAAGGKIEGAVIAKKFELNGGGILVYNPSADITDTPGVSFGSSSPPQVNVDVDKALERDY